MNELANIPGNIVVVLTQQGITNARSSEEDHLKRFITILRGDYKSGKKILLFLTNWSAIIHAYKRSSIITKKQMLVLNANEHCHAVARGIPYPTTTILDEI